MRSGDKTPIEQIPTPDLAVPYAAPRSRDMLMNEFKKQIKIRRETY